MSVDLSALGWDARRATEFRPFDRSAHRPARVTRVDRGVCAALTSAGAIRASLGGAALDYAAHDLARLPCAGDWIVVREWPDERATVEAVLPRRTAVVRASSQARSAGQILAVNLDTVAVVEPLDPAPDLGRIERLLALAWDSGAPPVVVLTKADLLANPVAVAASVAAIAPGVPVYAVSTRDRRTFEPLRQYCDAGHTLGLLGASGAGKSSLVNALVGTSVMGTRALRADGRGRHTTTYRALVPVPGGGALLDTPGLRQVGMYDATTGLERAFDDLAALALRCRFTGCAHASEPGCAVQAAIEAGELAPRRLASWRKLKRELAYELRRKDARLSAADRYRWRRA
jgi:ribosome biogenesis GTPase